jgi:hypothetical protein
VPSKLQICSNKAVTCHSVWTAFAVYSGALDDSYRTETMLPVPQCKHPHVVCVLERHAMAGGAGMDGAACAMDGTFELTKKLLDGCF